MKVSTLILSAFLILSLITPVVSAASYTLTVYVSDSDTSNPIRSASVYLDGKSKGATDSSGKITITGVLEGRHTVKVTKSGYLEASQDVYVSSNDQVTVSLKPKAKTPAKTPTPKKTPAISSEVFQPSVKGPYSKEGKEVSTVYIGEQVSLQFMLTNPPRSGKYVYMSENNFRSVSINPEDLVNKEMTTAYVVDNSVIPKNSEQNFKLIKELMSLPTTLATVLSGNIPISYIVSKGYGSVGLPTSPVDYVWIAGKNIEDMDRRLATNIFYGKLCEEGNCNGWIIPPGTTMVISVNMTMPSVQQVVRPSANIKYRYVYVEGGSRGMQLLFYGQNLKDISTMNQDFEVTAKLKKEINVKSKK